MNELFWETLKKTRSIRSIKFHRFSSSRKTESAPYEFFLNLIKTKHSSAKATRQKCKLFFHNASENTKTENTQSYTQTYLRSRSRTICAQRRKSRLQYWKRGKRSRGYRDINPRGIFKLSSLPISIRRNLFRRSKVIEHTL